MKKTFAFVGALLVIAIIISSCGGRKDCQGNRHRVKTEMGGFL
jgi:hypothetical protein